MSVPLIDGLHQAQAVALQRRGQGSDPDGGADKATEGTKGVTPAANVNISAAARQLLTAKIANDADGGADGK